MASANHLLLIHTSAANNDWDEAGTLLASPGVDPLFECNTDDARELYNTVTAEVKADAERCFAGVDELSRCVMTYVMGNTEKRLLRYLGRIKDIAWGAEHTEQPSALFNVARRGGKRQRHLLCEMLKVANNGVGTKCFKGQGHYALHAAAANRSGCTMLRLLLEQGAFIDCRDNKGSTPLHISVRTRNWGAVSVLLRAGADTTAMDLNGDTIVDLSNEDPAASTHLDNLLKCRKKAMKTKQKGKATKPHGETNVE